MNGTLKGVGGTAKCVVSADEVTLPGANAVAYARIKIESVSPHLPDGFYELEVNGETHRFRQHDGQWLGL